MLYAILCDLLIVRTVVLSQKKQYTYLLVNALLPSRGLGLIHLNSRITTDPSAWREAGVVVIKREVWSNSRLCHLSTTYVRRSGRITDGMRSVGQHYFPKSAPTLLNDPPKNSMGAVNRLRTGVGPFRSCLYKWGMTSGVTDRGRAAPLAS